jgi:hypothetical protein
MEASGFVFASNKHLVYALQQHQTEAIINIKFSLLEGVI